jgi:hypothetical protein
MARTKANELSHDRFEFRFVHGLESRTQFRIGNISLRGTQLAHEKKRQCEEVDALHCSILHAPKSRHLSAKQREVNVAKEAKTAFEISQHAKIRVESINGIFKKQDLGLYFRKQYPAPVKPMIFSEAVKKIGILDPSVVSLVVHFYMEIEMTERQTSFLIEGINRHPAAASSEEIVTAIMDQCLQQEVLGQKMNEALLAYQSALLDGRDIDDVAHKFDTRDSDRLVAARSMDLARRRSECTDTGKPASSETPSAR